MSFSNIAKAAAFLGVLGLTLPVCIAGANSGVSDERVSLPDGPGSMQGVGENVSTWGNMGGMQHEVPLRLPAGLPRASPALALSYSSLRGNELVGVGWDLPVPHIERSTLRGLPAYAHGDIFMADGHMELVRVQSAAGAHVYRARFEGSFIRYTWWPDREGLAGHWMAEYPDGSRGFFGAYPVDGEPFSRLVQVPEALARRTDSAEAGVFRYMLVMKVDSLGHAVRYHYTLDQRTPLLSRIEYAFASDAAGTTTDPRYVVELRYQARPDALSNALPGFELMRTLRLARVDVKSHGRLLRRYALSYEQAAAGTSRLRSVIEYGLDASQRLPNATTFGYSPSLHLDCQDCPRPFVIDLGKLEETGDGGLDLGNGRATLIDINGDALPDIVRTTNEAHHFYLNTMAASGEQSFTPPRASLGDVGGFALEQASVQVLDRDGDGLSDMVNTQTGKVLCNRGDGDWTTEDCPAIDLSGVELSGEAGDADPRGLRFLDANGDRRMDVLRPVQTGTHLWLQTDQGYQPAHSSDSLGHHFDDGSLLQLADLNGDGLLDAASVREDHVWYRLHLGLGHFGRVHHAPLIWPRGDNPSDVDPAHWDLQDLNGDGLDDAVAVVGPRIHFALQRAGEFLPIQTLRSRDLQKGQSLPERLADTTVLFADINGSGTTDVVWIHPGDGRVTALELFALRPNLLTRIDNGLGGIQTVQYGTAAHERARDAAAGHTWHHPLPMAVQLVTATERYATLSEQVRTRVQWRYHDGFYNGREKRFVGFAEVEEYAPRDESQQGSVLRSRYDVGARDAYRGGLLVHEELSAVGANTPLHSRLYTYGDCPLADALPHDPTGFAVRYPCQTRIDTLLQEGLPQPAWRNLRVDKRYDGYGQLVLQTDHGVVANAFRGCEPCDAPAGLHSGACGRECTGDEAYVATEYVTPGAATEGRWILGAAYRRRTYTRAPQAGADFTESVLFYDGRPFVGQRLGHLRAGLVTRVCQRASPEASPDCQGEGWVQRTRVQRDAHGNVVTELDPLGGPDDFSGHRRAVAYDARGLSPVRFTTFLSRDNTPYTLEQRLRYHPVFETPVWVSGVQRAEAATDWEEDATRIEYDDFGRVHKVAAPGDDLHAPTRSFRYDLAAPVSRIVVSSRSEAGIAADLRSIQCVDGLGRSVQSRTQIEPGRYRVTGHHELNTRGATARHYAPHEGGADCDASPPPGVPHTEYFYDAQGRPLRIAQPDAELYGTRSITRFSHEPLCTAVFDPGNSVEARNGEGLPNRRRCVDGLGRLGFVERPLAHTAGRVRALWDGLGGFAGYRDPAGHVKRQVRNLLGHVTDVWDPNSGHTHFEYDASGNLTAQTDSRGETVRTRYDGLNRPLTRYDPRAPETTRVRMQYDFVTGCDDCRHGEGKLVRVDYPLPGESAPGHDTWDYDARGRNVVFSRSLNGQRFSFHSYFDQANRLRRRVYPDGTELAYRYDRASRPLAIAGLVERVTYSPQGPMQGLRLSNGVRVAWNHDPRQRLTSILTRGEAGKLLQGFAYEHDRQGNVVSVADLSAQPERAADGSVRYAHDGWYRVTRAEWADETLDMTFDDLDNLVGKASSRGQTSAAHVGAIDYDGSRPNAVGRAAGIQFHYDAAGRWLQRGETVLGWDYQGRLSSAENAEGTRAEYAYGVASERIVARHGAELRYFLGPHFELRDGVSFTYARLGGQRVARIASTKLGVLWLGDANADARVDVGDVWLTRDRPPRQGSAHLRGCARRLLFDATGPRSWLHADHLQSLTLATGATGDVQGLRQFYPTGEVREARGYVDDYGFTGQRPDPVSRLVHFRYRELDPTTGRWASPDPLFLRSSPQSLVRATADATSSYAFVKGNFSSSLDPHGLNTRRTGRRPPPRDATAVSGAFSKLFGRRTWQPGGPNDSGRRNLEWIRDLILDGDTSLNLAPQRDRLVSVRHHPSGKNSAFRSQAVTLNFSKHSFVFMTTGGGTVWRTRPGGQGGLVDLQAHRFRRDLLQSLHVDMNPGSHVRDPTSVIPSLDLSNQVLDFLRPPGRPH